MKRILFRADASKEIGFGHFVRTLALADLLKDDFDCHFVTQKPTEWQKNEVAKVCQLMELPADDSKLDLFLQMITSEDIVFLDNYFNDYDYQLKIKSKGCKLVSMADTRNKFCADAVIGYIRNKSLVNVSTETRLEMGFDWVVLREPFLHLKHQGQNSNIVTICYGGSDQFCLTEKTVEILQEHFNFEINAVSNFSRERAEHLRKKNVKVFSNLSAEDLAQQYIKSRFVIASASTTSMEVSSVQTPLIMGYYVDNQVNLYKDLYEQNLGFGIGDLFEDIEEPLCQAIEKIGKEKLNVFDFSKAKDNYINLLKSL